MPQRIIPIAREVTTTLTLDPGVARVVALENNLAPNFCALIENTGDNPITAVRHRRRAQSDFPYGPWITPANPSIVPIGTGVGANTATIEVSGVVASDVEIELTAAVATTAKIYFAGSR